MINPSNCQVRFTPNCLYNLPPLLPPQNYQGRFTPQIAKYDLPASPNRPILSKISNAHNIMLCFTKVFSAKDQWKMMSWRWCTWWLAVTSWYTRRHFSRLPTSRLPSAWATWWTSFNTSEGEGDVQGRGPVWGPHEQNYKHTRLKTLPSPPRR